VIIGQIQFAKADTCDFCHVYFNGKIIDSFNVHNFGVGQITLKLSDLFENDSMTVMFWGDSRYGGNNTYLFVEGEKIDLVSKGIGSGTDNPISISMKDILKAHKKSRYNTFKVYFKEESEKRPDRIYLFKIKLE